MRFVKILSFIMMVTLILPAYASQPLQLVYRIKESRQTEMGYETSLSIAVINQSAQAYQNIVLVAENIHILGSMTDGNEIYINTIPANHAMRHNWTVESVIPFDEFAANSFYFHVQATDSLGYRIALPVQAVRE